MKNTRFAASLHISGLRTGLAIFLLGCVAVGLNACKRDRQPAPSHMLAGAAFAAREEMASILSEINESQIALDHAAKRHVAAERALRDLCRRMTAQSAEAKAEGGLNAQMCREDSVKKAKSSDSAAETAPSSG